MKITLIGLMFMVSSVAFASDNAQYFTGVAAVEGGPNVGCAVGFPSQTDAESDADQQAQQYCAGLNLKSVRLSAFTYTSNNCVASGPGYRYTVNELYAEAKYDCQ